MALTKKVADANAAIERAARWIHLPVGAGIATGNLKPETIFDVASMILHDRLVANMRLLPEFQIFDAEYPAAFDTDWSALFNALGSDGCAALRDRIGRVL